MKKPIREVSIGDKILGTDGKWHTVLEKSHVKIAYKMYELTFSNGKIKCAENHQWNIYVNNNMYTIDTEGLFQEFDFYKNRHIGTIDGPILLNIKQIDPELVQCLTTDSKDHQFAIYVDN